MTVSKPHLTLSNPWHLLATVFGSGLLPVIPGTIGSIVAIIFWLPIIWLLPIWFCWLVILIGFFAGIIVCQQVSNDIQFHDSNNIVWDEFIGTCITITTIPKINWKLVLIAFFFFRFFDILKPWPINWFDKKLNGGLGIMLDDVIASIFAIISTIIIIYQFF